MALDNEYKAKGEEEQAAEKKKSPAKKPASKRTKKPSKKSTPTLLTSLTDRINKKKLKSSIGIGLLLGALFIFLANFSYLLTWQEDQNRVMDKGFFEFLFDANAIPVANWL
ncbi:MAG: hypothetical protein ACI865_001436, partial [Flavobacteriaceae bacterium]